MSIKEPDVIRNDNGSETATWSNIAVGDTVLPWKRPAKGDKTYHVWGEFGGGTGISIKGSNDARMITNIGAASSFKLKDATTGDELDINTANTGGVVHANPDYIFPTAPVDGTATSITVSINASGGR